MKFYAIVLPTQLVYKNDEKTQYVLWCRVAGITTIFQSVEDAQNEIHLYGLSDSYDPVSIIELGAVVAGPKKEE